MVLVDPKQQEQFLEDAEGLGYQRREFAFHSSLEAIGGSALNRIRVSRGRQVRMYPHGDDVRWLGSALKDLYDGAFGPPDEQRVWNRPAQLTEGPLKGRWIADAYFTLPDGSRVEFGNPNRVFDSEADAYMAAKDWLRKHLKANP